MTEAQLRTLACQGILYRGSNLHQPEEVWDYRRKQWVAYRQHRLDAGDAAWIDHAAAEALKTNNPAAEHFAYYDSPPWAQPSP